MTESPTEKLLLLTSQIVSAHVGHNNVAADALPSLIHSVYQSLASVGQSQPPQPAEKKRPEPAVSPRRSVFPEYIICLEDGKKLKMLKRYLRSTYNLSPDEYRKRWGLPADYPMVAPAYAARRSEFAKKIGLGKGVRRKD